MHCEKCLGEIELRDDLVTATMLFSVVPYHEDCYAKDLKGAKTLFLNNQPINGFSGNFMTLFAFVVGIWLVIFADGGMKLYSVLFLIAVFYRLYSFYTFERHLEK